MSKQTMKWRTVQLPASLVEDVEVKVSKKGSSYTGISDYISDVLRQDLGVTA